MVRTSDIQKSRAAWSLTSGIGQAAGTAPASFTSNLLEDKRLAPEEEFDLKWSAASLYSGAVIVEHSRSGSDFCGRWGRYCKSHQTILTDNGILVL
jgi:hypothetical protein